MDQKQIRNQIIDPGLAQERPGEGQKQIWNQNFDPGLALERPGEAKSRSGIKFLIPDCPGKGQKQILDFLRKYVCLSGAGAPSGGPRADLESNF